MTNQGLKFFVEMQGTYYLDLVRVFYSNYKYRYGVAFTKVKGIYIILDSDILENVAKLPIPEDVVNVLTEVEGFNRQLTFRSFLKIPQ